MFVKVCSDDTLLISELKSEIKSKVEAKVEAKVKTEVKSEVEAKVEFKIESKAEYKVPRGARRWGSNPKNLTRKIQVRLSRAGATVE